jgi:hypothetical protein
LSGKLRWAVILPATFLAFHAFAITKPRTHWTMLPQLLPALPLILIAPNNSELDYVLECMFYESANGRCMSFPRNSQPRPPFPMAAGIVWVIYGPAAGFWFDRKRAKSGHA